MRVNIAELLYILLLYERMDRKASERLFTVIMERLGETGIGPENRNDKYGISESGNDE